VSRQARPSYQFGPFRFDPSEQLLLCGGHPLSLTPKAVDVLRVLVENAGHLVDKEQLLKDVWPDCFVEEGALSRYVSLLRKTLSEADPSQQYIATVPKRGYRFVATVVEGHAEPSAGDRTRSGEYPVCADVVAPMTVGAPPLDPDARPGPRVTTRPVAAWGWARLMAGFTGALLSVSYAMLEPSAIQTRPKQVGPLPAPVHRQVTFTGSDGAPTVSPDGRRLAYVSSSASAKSVVVETLPGGHPVVVFAAPEVGYLRWSPDGDHLLFWARGAGYNGVYVTSSTGGTPRSIAPRRYVACWSPDGSAIAVVSYVGQMWFFDPNGQPLRTVSLEGPPQSIWDVDWSSATGLLAFTSGDGRGPYSIWTMQPDGEEQITVLAEQAEIPAVRWAPRGDALYYLRRTNQTDSLQKLPIRNGRAGAPIATLMTGLETDRAFAVSADGKRLVYARAPFYSNLWRLDVDRTDISRRQLTRGTSLVERPRVSPDGTTVVFTLGHEPRAELYTLPIAGGRPERLTFLDAFSVGGGWSPDGRQIAFASTLGGKPRVWTMEVAGGQARAVPSSDLSDTFDLVFTPGSRILFQQPGNRNYSELDPEAHGERPLLAESASAWVFSPIYSPDGTKIALFRNQPPDRGIWVVDAAGGGARLLHRTTKSIDPVGWSADGRTVYVVEAEVGPRRGLTAPNGESKTHARILALSFDGRTRTVAQLPGEIGGVGMSPDASRFVYAMYLSHSDVWVVDDFDSTPGRAESRASR
jgi:Tol biopolymer transport system component/DNA-binding winged helix-turn-helix (wHTH) protein